MLFKEDIIDIQEDIGMMFKGGKEDVAEVFDWKEEIEI
jgi:hypothetical protein